MERRQSISVKVKHVAVGQLRQRSVMYSLEPVGLPIDLEFRAGRLAKWYLQANVLYNQSSIPTIMSAIPLVRHSPIVTYSPSLRLRNQHLLPIPLMNRSHIMPHRRPLLNPIPPQRQRQPSLHLHKPTITIIIITINPLRTNRNTPMLPISATLLPLNLRMQLRRHIRALRGAKLVVCAILGDGSGSVACDARVGGGDEVAAVEGAEEGFEAGDGGGDEGEVHYG